jgi:hypothetical protein
MKEDLSIVLTVSGESVDDNTTSTLSYRITTLLDPACMKIFQWDTTTRRRGYALTTTIPSNLIQASTREVMARMVYGSRSAVTSTNGCPFEFVAVQIHVLSAVPQLRVSIAGTHDDRTHSALCLFCTA